MRQKNYEEERYFQEEENEIDLLDLIFIIIRRWKIIVLMIIPTVLLGSFFAMTRPSIYQADTTLIVSSGMQSVGLESSDIALNQKLVVTYSKIAKSRDILTRVISKYDLSETPEILENKILINVIEDTELIRISYLCHDSKLAEAVTNELANEFIKKVGQVMKIRNISVVERAVEPDPLPRGKGKIILLSVFLGTLLGIGMIFFIEFLHKKVRKSSDMEKILGVQMLGMIPEIETANKGEENHES